MKEIEALLRGEPINDGGEGGSPYGEYRKDLEKQLRELKNKLESMIG